MPVATHGLLPSIRKSSRDQKLVDPGTDQGVVYAGGAIAHQVNSMHFLATVLLWYTTIVYIIVRTF